MVIYTKLDYHTMTSPFPKRKSSQEKFVKISFKNLLDIDANNEYYSNDYYIDDNDLLDEEYENEINLSPEEIEHQIALLESYEKKKTTEEKLTELRNEMISSAKSAKNKIIYETKKASDQIVSDTSTYHNFQSFDDQKIVIDTLANIFKFFPLRSMLGLQNVCKTFYESFKLLNFTEIYIDDDIIDDFFTARSNSKLINQICNRVQIIYFEMPYDYFGGYMETVIPPLYMQNGLKIGEKNKFIKKKLTYVPKNLRKIIIELDHAQQIFYIPRIFKDYMIIKSCSNKTRCKFCDFNLLESYMIGSIDRHPLYHNNQKILR